MVTNTFKPLRQPAEPRRAGLYAGSVLAMLLFAKMLGPVPFVGAIALGGAVFVQLWLPLSRCDAWGLSWSALGLDLRHWRAELRDVATCAVVILPVYGFATAWFYMHGSAWLVDALGPNWRGAVPVAHWGGVPRPDSPGGWLTLAWMCFEALATHVLGVALPEETFFRGYLQAQWQQVWPVSTGVGRAAVAACALFALGHFLGEWNPARLLPFFPGLLFAWQRNRRGSLVGCIALHALCNLFSAGWAACFVPGNPSPP